MILILNRIQNQNHFMTSCYIIKLFHGSLQDISFAVTSNLQQTTEYL